MFPEKKKYKSDHVLLDKETLEQDLKDFSFTFIELPKFTNTIEQLSNIQEKWCYFFKHAEEMTPEDLEKIIGNDKIIERVYHELDRFYWTEAELAGYDQAEKEKNDYLSSLEQKRLEGRVEEQAEERAKTQQEKILAIKEVARNLCKAGMPASSIQTATRLSQEEIEAL